MSQIRRLGFGELRMHLMHAEFNGTTQGAFRVRIEGPLDEAALPAAVASLVRRYPMLRSVIKEGSDGDFAFHEHVGIEQEKLVRLHRADVPIPDVAVIELANAELVDATRQLWRLHCFTYTRMPQVHDLVLVMHHAAMDASGADLIMGDLLKALGGLAATSAPTLCEDEYGFPAAMEESCLVAVPWSEFEAASKEMAARTAACHPPMHQSNAILLERETAVAIFCLDADEIGQIERRCRASGVSLNAFFSAAWMQAVAAAMSEREQFALYTAVSLRRLCPGLKEDQLGCCLSVVPTFHHQPVKQPLLALAAEQAQHLHMAFLEWAKPPQEYSTNAVKAALSRAHGATAFFNDIGFTYAESGLRPTYGPIHVQSVQVVARRLMGNVAVILHGLRHAGRVFFTLSHTRPLFDEATASRIKTEFEHRLRTNETHKE